MPSAGVLACIDSCPSMKGMSHRRASMLAYVERLRSRFPRYLHGRALQGSGDMIELDSTGQRQDRASHRRRILLRAALCSVALPAPFVALAQQQPKVWRIGLLASDSSSTRVYDGFRQGMRELGYVE